MNSVHNPDTGLHGPFIKISIPLSVNRHPSLPPFHFQQSHLKGKLWGLEQLTNIFQECILKMMTKSQVAVKALLTEMREKSC